jgi:hypothetical protein
MSVKRLQTYKKRINLVMNCVQYKLRMLWTLIPSYMVMRNAAIVGASIVGRAPVPSHKAFPVARSLAGKLRSHISAHDPTIIPNPESTMAKPIISQRGATAYRKGTKTNMNTPKRYIFLILKRSRIIPKGIEIKACAKPMTLFTAPNCTGEAPKSEM